MNKYEEFEKIVKDMKVDFEKFYDKGVAAAGARVRKACQDLVVLSRETRKDVILVKNSRKEAKS